MVGGSGGVSGTALDHAYRLGAEIVRDAILLTGGDGSDAKTIKDAAIRGALSTVRTISILKEKGGMQRGTGTIRSGWDHGRNILNALACDAMIALEGGAGTLSEVAFAQMVERRIVVFGGAETKLETELQDADFTTIIKHAAPRADVLPVACNAGNVKKYAAEALAKAFRTSDVQQAVLYAMEAPLRAFLPPIDGVDPEEWERLLERYGRGRA